MDTHSSSRVSTAIGFTLLAVGGFWLGAFAWFGGYVWVKQAFAWSAIAIGLTVVLVRSRSSPRRWLSHAALFLGSQLLFVVCVAAGQVFYVGPSSTMEAARLFGLAMRGGL
ncbi:MULTISPECIES: hypothetical protein [unclassified Rhodanobacter]|uniref:hypothetical protein n=1 Tax=unclassified Rhodanobacter TaxID=2621553 RepID=UPI001BDE417C|nr:MULTISPECIES: hypothetical protein [unclassified Rhodanobacter]MBT2144194.1 hypothetical protein [Rhodanobacter sp. LX-99]MBT2150139.1 hypothetical protein [Rhodanobacter sp. LX-100]